MIETTSDISIEWHALRSQMASRITWPDGLAEFIDNSFDNGASRVYIRIEKDSVEISDDGNGCADFIAMFKYGRHVPSATTDLGRYGVGGKAAAMMLARVYEVRTCKDGLCSWGSIVWDQVTDPTGFKWRKEETDEPNGTVVRLSSLLKKAQPEPIKRGLSFTFAPAIWSGKRIDISVHGGDAERLAAWEKPRLREETIVHDSYTNGRGYNLLAGITEAQADRGPFVLAYNHRVLCCTPEPCGEFSGSRRFFAFVELTGDWKLEKHKNALVDELESEWLYQSLHASTRHLLEQVETEGELIELDQIAAIIAGCLNLRVGRAARPGDPNATGPVRPKDTDRTVKEADQITPTDGDVVERKSKNTRGFQIKTESLEPEKLGRVDSNRKRIIVFLNKENPVYRQAQFESKTNRNANLMLSICLALLAAEHSMARRDRNQALIQFESDLERKEFDQAYEKLMVKLIKVEESANA